MWKVASYFLVGIAAFLIGRQTLICSSHADDAASDIQQSDRRQHDDSEKGTPGKTVKFSIEGMMCQGCADTITDAVKRIPGVRSVQVSLPEKSAMVVLDESQASSEKIISAVETAGYKARVFSAKTELPIKTVTVEPVAKPELLINLTRGKTELHAASMAIGLAQSAQKDGRETVLFLNVDAPVFAAKDQGEDVKFADFPPIKKMIADFIAAGGRVLVCKHCAHVLHLTPTETLDGVKWASHEDLFNIMKPGIIVFSY